MAPSTFEYCNLKKKKIMPKKLQEIVIVLYGFRRVRGYCLGRSFQWLDPMADPHVASLYFRNIS